MKLDPDPSAASLNLPARRSAWIPELDALRGLGAMAILGFHLWPTTFYFGWTRVDLFFVLSGYLVTSILLRHDSSLRFLPTFWVRRGLRVLPAYYLLLTIICIRSILEGSPPRLDSLIAHLTFTQNMPYYWWGDVPTSPSAAIQTWSLAIEAQFYLFWPFVIFIAGRSSVIPVGLWLIANSVAARMLGLYTSVSQAPSEASALGAIHAAVTDGSGIRRTGSRWWVVGLASAGLIALSYLASPLAYLEAPIARIPGCGPVSILAVNITYFSIVGLCIRFTGHRWLFPLRTRVICGLGRMSYGIYLYHLVIIEMVDQYFGPRTLMTDASAVLLSLLAAAISERCLERPIVALGKTSRSGVTPKGTASGSSRGRGTAHGIPNSPTQGDGCRSSGGYDDLADRRLAQRRGDSRESTWLGQG